MFDNWQQLKADLERYMNNLDTIEGPLEEDDYYVGLDGNITLDEVREGNQFLLYLVVKKSASMQYAGLEKEVMNGFNEIMKIVQDPYYSKGIQTAMTFFGDTVDMKPFMYGEDLKFDYEANERESCLYDAIVLSCNNMVSQYDRLKYDCNVNAAMLIFADDADDDSEQYTLGDVHRAIWELKKRGITCAVVGFKGIDASVFEDELWLETAFINDKCQWRSTLNRVMHLVSRPPFD